MVLIFCLKLEKNKYFIESTEINNFNFKNDFDKDKFEFTKKYKPIELHQLIPDCSKFDGDKIVKMYMNKYGINNVRGFSYKTNRLSRNEIVLLKKELETVNRQNINISTKNIYSIEKIKSKILKGELEKLISKKQLIFNKIISINIYDLIDFIKNNNSILKNYKSYLFKINELIDFLQKNPKHNQLLNIYFEKTYKNTKIKYYDIETSIKNLLIDIIYIKLNKLIINLYNEKYYLFNFKMRIKFQKNLLNNLYFSIFSNEYNNLCKKINNIECNKWLEKWNIFIPPMFNYEIVTEASITGDLYLY